jgi:hypothetical protein
MRLTRSGRAMQIKRIGGPVRFPTIEAGGYIPNGQQRRSVFRCLYVARKGLVFDSILPGFCGEDDIKIIAKSGREVKENSHIIKAYW